MVWVCVFLFDLETFFDVEHIMCGFGIESFILVEQCLIFGVAYRAAIDLPPNSMQLLSPLRLLNLLLPVLHPPSLSLFYSISPFPFLVSLCKCIPVVKGVYLRTPCNVLFEFSVIGVLLLSIEERNRTSSLASELI